jgi:type III restriction enzyme
LAADPELAPIGYPTTIEEKKADKSWSRHLYVDKEALYSAKLNKWETRVVEEELGKKEVVGWLRNPPRKSWSLCVPYTLGGQQRPLYPDFLFVRSDSGEFVVDLLDPHRMDLEDAPAKAAGLARYSDKHCHEFGRIELIIVNGDEIKRLDLADELVRARVRGVNDHTHLRQLYESATG